MAGHTPLFAFGELPNLKLQHFEKKETKEILQKWSMADGLSIQGFYYDRPFKTYLLSDFIQAFFGSSYVMGKFLRLSHNRQFEPAGIQAEAVKFQNVRCTLTDTKLFRRLTADGSPVARTTGAIKKCLPDYYQPNPEIHDDGDPIEISDELRKLMTCYVVGMDDRLEYMGGGDADAEMFTEAERDEFLFRLFSHFVLGGSLCQYEDNVEPYIQMAKGVYKDLVTVSTVSDSLVEAMPVSSHSSASPSSTAQNNTRSSPKRLAVTSVVAKVTSVKNENYAPHQELLFLRSHVNNFLYVIIQPEEQTVYTLYHQVI